MLKRYEDQEEVPAFIRDVMPNATEAELEAAHQTAKDFVDIVIRIFERAEREKGTPDSSGAPPDDRIRDY